ncbi:dockerin type I domain-containing protein [Lacipirellula parvula]|uniref:Ice-binding protein C-terminal domain-containing protein n=1 Tax=Lacipirellula parvula TaxID=2650471 RepID=A0A5K7X3T0_9BACT|nr:dockerin type I domain-containing protein [Lacipirellula parvula]BBO30482.1 hypothetical protein PLANPX_0094 [Lacipirellula parvula]
MKKNIWRRRLAAAMAGGAVVSVASMAQAIEMANVTADGAGTSNPVAVSIASGQGTPNFFIESGAVTGQYPIRIGASATDDYTSGVLLTSVRENGGRSDGLGIPFWPISSITTTPIQGAAAPDGKLALVVDARVGSATVPANGNLAAAYFPFSEGWIGGTTRSTANGGNPNDQSVVHGVNLIDLQVGFNSVASGIHRVKIPTVTDSRQQGLLFTNHAKNEDNYSAVAPDPTGDGWIVATTHGGNALGFEPDPYTFVYLPYGTPNITMASIHGASGPNMQPTVMNKSGSPFTIVREGIGTYRLSIPGQTPSSGTLLTNTGGPISGSATSTTDNVLTYQAADNGTDWIIQTRDYGQGTAGNVIEPYLETPIAERSQAFQFAFMPFATPPTAPGPNITPLNLKDKVIGFNVAITEVDASQQAAPNNYGVVTEGTAGYRLEHLRQDRGDNSIAINGVFPSKQDGIMFGTISQGFRDNTTLPNNPSGQAAYGMIAAADGGAGWEFATHIADPGAVAGALQEFNVNFSAVFFGNDTPFSKAQAQATTGGSLTVALPGVNSLNDGILVAQVGGNIDSFAVATPDVNGANWTVKTYSNDTTATTNPVNWIYLPYEADNLVAGRVSANGTVVNSTGVGAAPGQFTLTKEAGSGSYLLTIPGKTPADGTLLLTPEATAGLEDNLLTYEAAGNSFRIFSIDQVTADERQLSFITPSLEDTNFTFAFIDYDLAPTLNPGGNFLAADFNEDGNVDGADLTAWKAGFGTGTTKAQGDANEDGKVDGADFLTWQHQFGQTPAVAAAGSVAAAVPEPSSLLLIGVAAAVGLGAVRRRS